MAILFAMNMGQAQASQPVGISSKGNAAGVYDFKNKVMPVQTVTTQSQPAKANAGEVEVTARKIEEDISVVPRSVEVIKNDKISDSGEEKLQDVLDSVTGTLIQRNGGYQGQSSVSLRGAPSAHTLVLLDGIPINDMLAGGADLNKIDITNIDRIEIVKGGLSSIYGGEAAAGVINVITETKGDKPISLSAEYGTDDYQKYTAASDYKIFGVNYSISAVQEQSEGYVANSDFLKRSINAKLAFTGDVLDSQLIGYYYHRDMGVPFGPGGGLSTDRQGDENFNLGLNEKFAIGPTVEKISGYIRSEELLYLNNGVTSNHKKKEYNASLFAIYDEGGFFSGMTGTESSVKTIDSTVIGKSQNSNEASITSLTFKFFDNKLIINSGFRADFNSVYNNMTSENLSAKYKFPENVDIHVSFDKSFQAPTMGELYWHEDGVYDGYPWHMYGNLNLKPESSAAYEAGISKKDDKISESITYFRNDINDMIINNSDYTSWINLSKASISGLEAKVDITPADYFAFYVHYTYLRAVDGDNKPLDYRPQGNLTAGINVKLPYDIKFVANGQYVDSRRYNGVDSLKPYYLLNCSIMHKISSNVKVSFDLNNILDNTTYEVVKGYKMPGRNMSVSMGISF
jgi:vitamin B12 transporter